MNQNGYLKVAYVVAFLLLAAVSCWATAESLHLLLPSWPSAMCWAVTVSFFFIASWGTKMIADSLNQRIYMEKRGACLVGGVVIVLLFWLPCSMPTNTHTFFYRNAISQKVGSDIGTTKAYLAQIRDNTKPENEIREKQHELENEVKIKLKDLEAEIKVETAPGFGPKSKEILGQLADILGVPKIEPLTYRHKSVEDLNKLCTAYREKIYLMMESRKENIAAQLTPKSDLHRRQADKDYKNLDLTQKYISEGKIDLNDAEDINVVCDKLNAGYTTIRTYKEFVNFNGAADKAAYTSPNAVTKVSRMLSVFDVWEDYFKGDFAGRGFIFWIILSVLVDVAAFIFFDIAFRKSEE